MPDPPVPVIHAVTLLAKFIHLSFFINSFTLQVGTMLRFINKDAEGTSH